MPRAVMPLLLLLLRVREDTHETSWMILSTGSLRWNRSRSLADPMRRLFLAFDWGVDRYRALAMLAEAA